MYEKVFNVLLDQKVLFVCVDALCPVNDFSVMPGSFPLFLDGTSIKQQIKCLAEGHKTVTLPAVRFKLATLQSPV